MHCSATTLVLLAKIACFRPQQRLLSVPKRLVFRQKKGSFRRKSLSFATETPLFGSAERSQAPFFFYFICKYFAIVLSVRQKRSVRFDFRHRPFPWPETDDSQAVGKSKCHFDKTAGAPAGLTPSPESRECRDSCRSGLRCRCNAFPRCA